MWRSLAILAVALVCAAVQPATAVSNGVSSTVVVHRCLLGVSLRSLPTDDERVMLCADGGCTSQVALSPPMG
jgi:hypothetical protein